MKINNQTREFLRKIKSEGETGDLSRSVLVVKDDRIPLGPNVRLRFGSAGWRVVVRFRKRTDVPGFLAELDRNWFNMPKTMTAKDCWEMEAETDDGLLLRPVHVFHPVAIQTIEGGGTSFEFPFHKIEFPKRPVSPELLEQVERLTRRIQEEEKREDRFDAELEVPNKDTPSSEESPSPQEKPELSTTSKMNFLAVLPGIELKPRNHSTSTETVHPFHGRATESKLNLFLFENERYEACFETVDEDLEIHIRFKPESAAILSDEEAVRISRGLVDAVGFVHGCHPLPYFLHCERDGRTLEKWVQPYNKLVSGSGLPMSDARIFQDRGIVELIQKAAEFFAKDTEIGEYVKQALYFFRQSDKPGTAYEIRLLAQCSLLEGLITDLWKVHGEKEEPELFRRIKALVIRAAKSQAGKKRREDTHGLLRKLAAYLENWSYWRIRERWEHTCDALDLPWDHFESVYRDWNHYRHPLAHGFKERKRPTNVSRKIIAYSRFSGAINILSARIMGFSGNIEKSFLEGTEAVALREKAAPPENVP